MLLQTGLFLGKDGESLLPMTLAKLSTRVALSKPQVSQPYLIPRNLGLKTVFSHYVALGSTQWAAILWLAVGVDLGTQATQKR